MSAKEFKFKYYRCNQVGHKWFECHAKVDQGASFASEDYEFDSNGPIAFFAKHRNNDRCENKSESRSDAMKAKVDEGSRVIKMFLDSGSTNHMVNDSNLFVELIEVAKSGATMNSKQKGDISVKMFQKGRATKLLLRDVLLVEELKCNLLSIGKMEQAGMEIAFKNGAAYVYRISRRT